MPDPEPEPDVNPFDQLDNVQLHRAEQFRRLGFGDLDTLFLLSARVDWHDAEKLLVKLRASGYDDGGALAFAFEYLT